MDDLMRLDAIAQAALVRSGDISAAELVDTSIAQIDQMNPVLNAVVTPMFDSARELAKQPLGDGPFAGVPLLLKDHLAEYAGAPLAEGSRFLKDYVSPRDSELVGLKPMRGRNPMGPAYGDMASGLVHEHVVTRTVRDTAAILDVTAGPDLGAPYFAPPPARPFLEEVGADPGKLRICFSTRPVMGTEINPICESAVRETAALCADLGHQVEEDPPTPKIDPDRFSNTFTTVWLATVAWAIRNWARKTGQTPSEDRFEAHTWKMFTLGKSGDSSDYLFAVQDMQAMAREITQHYNPYDVWLTPTLTQPPVPLGYYDFDPAAKRRSTERMGDIPRFTAIANVTGQPAISLPLQWTDQGLPIGIQLLGRYGDEATILRLSAQLEKTKPWADRWPPNC